MTVRASHLALPDLSRDVIERPSLTHHRADVGHLVAKVVEVEDREIMLAAVDAWVSAQVRVDNVACPLLCSPP